MAQPLSAPGLDSLAGVDARYEAILKLEMLTDEVDAVLARRKANGILRRGIKAWRRGNISRAAQHALAATEADPTSAKAFHVLAMTLERMGHLHKALVTYERAFELDPDDSELLINLGLIAWRMKMPEGAETMFRHFIAAKPDSPLGYNNLGSVLSDTGRVDAALEMLRAAIFRMPTESILWNSLATVLAEDGRVEESLIFYREAIRLDPQFARLYHNLGYAYSHLGRLVEALECYDSALTYVTDPTEILEATHSRGVCLIGMGRLRDGFREYEVRNNPQFRAYVHHMVDAPQWKGEPLQGRRVLVVAEQGLGDEFMFADVLPDLQAAVKPGGKLQIAVDPRLVTLFARSFPEAEVGRYDDRMLIDRDGNKELRFVPFATDNGPPDVWLTMGSALQYLRKSVDQFPHRAFLKPDPARVAELRAKLETLGTGPFVGLCWRSMFLSSKRAKYFSALDAWAPILRTKGATFVNVQYGDCADEIARAEEALGIKIHVVEGLDIKDDIDGAAALSGALDLVISAPTAAAAIAGSVGAEVWFLTAGRTWPQLGTDEYPWYRRTRVFSPEDFGDWASVMPRVADALSALVASKSALRLAS